jgi:alcohol dehydrogenase (cytochrome c)
MRLSGLLFLTLLPPAFAQDIEAGRRQFESRCASCHGGDANGGEHGPGIVNRLTGKNDEQLAAFIRSGAPAAGMPGINLNDMEMRQVIAFLRSLNPTGPPPERLKVETTSGKTLDGVILNQSSQDLQLQTDDKQIHLLRKEGNRYRPVTSQTDWPTYNGQVNGNRYTTVDQIKPGNVSRLAMKWFFSLPNTSNLQGTPIVSEGVMYVTSANECYALDAGSGRQIWHFRRPRTPRLIGNAAGGINRGVAVAKNRVFMVTDNAHIIALDRFTGKLVWETEMADWRQNYNATSAPLIVGDLVVSGTAGGDEGVRGFLTAFDQNTGKEVWRFWTVPLPGEPGSETWKGDGIHHPAAAAWFTGSYDPQLDMVYWQTGNPGADLVGDNRLGDNLYASSTVALDAKTGKLKWYFQYTPHDVWDWDAVQTEVLVDTVWQGEPRKLLLHANRNGFFYVLDRTDGKLLRATPLVKKLTWATKIGADGRPVMTPNNEPTLEGNRICPPLEGATNWYSPSFNPLTGLFYVQTLEKCEIYRKTPTEWAAGKGYMGGSTRLAPGDKPQKVLRAFDLKTGAVAWELPEIGPANSWGGTLSTASGLVFFADDSGALAAADAKTGKPLWSFQTNQLWKASPMTYVFDGKQHIAIASGPNILAFALTQ